MAYGILSADSIQVRDVLNCSGKINGTSVHVIGMSKQALNIRWKEGLSSYGCWIPKSVLKNHVDHFSINLDYDRISRENGMVNLFYVFIPEWVSLQIKQL